MSLLNCPLCMTIKPPFPLSSLARILWHINISPFKKSSMYVPVCHSYTDMNMAMYKRSLNLREFTVLKRRVFAAAAVWWDNFCFLYKLLIFFLLWVLSLFLPPSSHSPPPFNLLFDLLLLFSYSFCFASENVCFYHFFLLLTNRGEPWSSSLHPRPSYSSASPVSPRQGWSKCVETDLLA